METVILYVIRIVFTASFLNHCSMQATVALLYFLVASLYLLLSLLLYLWVCRHPFFSHFAALTEHTKEEEKVDILPVAKQVPRSSCFLPPASCLLPPASCLPPPCHLPPVAPPDLDAGPDGDAGLCGEPALAHYDDGDGDDDDDDVVSLLQPVPHLHCAQVTLGLYPGVLALAETTQQAAGWQVNGQVRALLCPTLLTIALSSLLLALALSLNL